MARDDMHELYGDLRKQAPKFCPSCKANDWLPTAEVPVVLPQVDLSGPNPTAMPGIEALFMICGECGFVRLHSTQALRLLK